MKKNLKLFLLGPGVLFSLYLFGATAETYIDYTLLSKIKLKMDTEEVISILGDPILILSDSEYDNSIYTYYNYKIKQFDIEGGVVDLNSRRYDNERNVLIKFSFIDGELQSWEEDNMTLKMAGGKTKTTSRNSLLHYFSMLLNVIFLIKII